MSSVFELPHPKAPAALEKIVVHLGEDAWHGFSTETLWVARLDSGAYQIRNTPFFAMGLAYLDVVSARVVDGQLLLDRVEERSGRSTYRLLIKDLIPSADVLSRFEELNRHRCTYESYVMAPWTLFAWDIPPSEVAAAYKILEEGEKAKLWDFEEGHFGGYAQ